MKKVLVILTLLIIVFSVYMIYERVTYLEIDNSLLLKTEKENPINIDKYTIYGKWFNIEGTINIDYDYISLSLLNENREINYNLQINDNHFQTNKHINEGINLENIDLGNYLILIKIEKNNEVKYYNLVNDTSYKDLNYYTFIKNKNCNNIKVSFSKKDGYSYMKMNVLKERNTKNIYDIIIDPGHGGVDPGAVNGKYKEKDFNLDYAKTLKKVLEENGIKAKLTRESDIDINRFGINSRTGISYESKAKLMLSIHLNSSSMYLPNGGVEVYSAYNNNYKVARLFAGNIVKYANTVYSKNPSSRIDNGIYMRTMSESDIKSVSKKAEKEGFTMYENMDTTTTYYYFIRETGGIITKAYTDGRNKDTSANPYMNSNHGVEAYLLELGYISSNKDLNRIINNKDLYIKSLVESIKSYINNEV